MNNSETQKGLLVVRRINWQTDLPIDDPVFESDINQPAIPLSHEDIRNRYRGLDGWPWPDCPNVKLPPLIDGLATLKESSVVEKYYKEVSKSYLCDFLYLDVSKNTSSRPYLPDQFVLLGYDNGYYVSEWNYFSSLLHEVIYGVHEQMTRYAKLVNDNLLLPNIELGKQLHATRTELLRDPDACLERDGEILSPIAIYGRASLR